MNNSITIVGHVGQNPHTVPFEDTGNKLVKFSVAVKEFSSNTDEDKTLWIDVDAWNGLGERALKTITKGREVVVNGRLAIATYPKEVNGVKVQKTKSVIKLPASISVARSPHLSINRLRRKHRKRNSLERKLNNRQGLAPLPVAFFPVA